MHELQVSTHCDSLQVFTDWSKKVNEQFMSQQRNCLMLLDNASSHGVADTLVTKVGSLDAFRLTNLLLLFLPPNCTSVVQPLDQGIIAAFKAHYKRKLARYMVQQYTTLIPVRIYRRCRLRPILSRSVFFSLLMIQDFCL